jgi:hypothetical protein
MIAPSEGKDIANRGKRKPPVVMIGIIRGNLKSEGMWNETLQNDGFLQERMHQRYPVHPVSLSVTAG